MGIMASATKPSSTPAVSSTNDTVAKGGKDSHVNPSL